MAARYFSPKFFELFEELEHNNNREWFLKNKSRYENEVRDPMLAFIAAFAPQLKKISANYVADPSPSGGSMMRIYRNLRFSRDKTPTRPTPPPHSVIVAPATSRRRRSICRSPPAKGLPASESGIRNRKWCAKFATRLSPARKVGRRPSTIENFARASNSAATSSPVRRVATTRRIR
jgi:hypothetical protein